MNKIEEHSDFCYDIDQIFEEDKQSLVPFICPINLGVFKDPITAVCCGNTICKSCFTKSMESTGFCPLCRNLKNKILSNNTIVLSLKNFINTKRIYCDKKEKGCEWLGKIDNYSEHFKQTCLYTSTNCAFCKLSFLRLDLKLHEEQCPKRPMNCPFCKLKLVQKELKGHTDRCQLALIDCSDCQEKIIRKNNLTHSKTECQGYSVDCIARLFGCNEKVKRRDFASHWFLKHSDLMERLFQTQTQILAEITDIKMGMIQNSIYTDLRVEREASFLYPRDFQTIKTFFKNNSKGKLVLSQRFKSSREGHSLDKFHKICDSLGPTIFFIKTSDNLILGGYTSVSWDSTPSKGYKLFPDSESFLFSVSLEKKFPNKTRMNNIPVGKNFGPSISFGLWVYYNTIDVCLFCNEKSSAFTMDGCTVSEILGNSCEISTLNPEFYEFKITELEVFSVRFEDSNI